MDTLIFKEEIMQIKFYNITCERNKANKAPYLKNEWICEGNLVDGTSYLRPSVRIQIENFGYNYAIINEFGRWYFISNIIVERNGVYRIDMVVDVLGTYYASYSSVSMLFSRCSNENLQQKYLADPVVFPSNEFTNEVIFSENIEELTTKLSDNISSSTFRSFIVAVVDSRDSNYFPTLPNITSTMFGWLEGVDTIYTGVSPAYTLYALNNNEIATLFNSIRDNQELASYIIYCRALPLDFDKSPWSLFKSTTEDIVVKLPDKDPITLLSNATVLNLGNGCLYPIYDGLNITTDSMSNDFRDYSPYSTYQLYLPFYGTINIDYSYLLYGLKLDCVLNVVTGEIIYSLYTKDSSDNQRVPLRTFTAKAYVELVVSSTNYQEIQRTVNAIETKNLGSVIVSMLTLVAGAVMVAIPGLQGIGAGAIIGGASGVGASAVNRNSSLANVSNPVASTFASDNSADVAIYQPIFIQLTKITKKSSVNMDTLNNFFGRMSYQSSTLGQIGEGTIFSVYEVHLSDIQSAQVGFYATETELEELESLLKGICIN